MQDSEERTSGEIESLKDTEKQDESAETTGEEESDADLTGLFVDLEFVDAYEVPDKLQELKEKIAVKSRMKITDKGFVSLISLFSHDLSPDCIRDIFQILLSAELTWIQLLSFFDWRNRVDSKEYIHRSLSWSFMDQNIAVRRYYSQFIQKMVVANRLLADDAIRAFLLLIDDEDLLVRTTCYIGLLKTVKHEMKKWSPEEKKKFRHKISYFGPLRLQMLKQECLEQIKKKKNVQIAVENLGSATRISVRLGSKIRKGTEITVKGEDIAEYTTIAHQKHTVIYCAEKGRIECIVKRNGQVLLEKSIKCCSKLNSKISCTRD